MLTLNEREAYAVKVKQVSELTGISVPTLYHYDKIGLLRPIIRKKKWIPAIWAK